MLADNDEIKNIIVELDLLIRELREETTSEKLTKITLNNLLDFRNALESAQTKNDIGIANSILINFIVGSFDYDDYLYKRLDELTEKVSLIADN